MSSQRVLVVDDEPKMQRVLEMLLRKLGHEVLLAADGQAALTLAQSVPVDLVMTDLHAGHGWHRALERAAGAWDRGAGDSPDGIRHRRERGHGDEEGRVRLYSPAVRRRGRGSRGHQSLGAGASPA